MHQGWKRRREMEAAIGREALRRARLAKGPVTCEAGSHSGQDRIAHACRLAELATDDALAELESIVDTEDDEVRFAARAALRIATSRLRQRAVSQARPWKL
jgi:hypothetical protein